MADSIVQSLTKRAFSSLADLTGVRIWSGKGSESDALGLEVPELLTSDIITDASLDYKALTGKGFNASVATEGRLGITKHASAAQIDAGTAGNLVVIASQLKRKYDELYNSVSVSFTGTPDANFSSVSLNGNRLGKSWSITGSFIAVNSNYGNPKYLGTIAAYVSPGYIHRFVLQSYNTSVIEGGYGYINTNGAIYIVAGKGSSQTWYFGTSPISA